MARLVTVVLQRVEDSVPWGFRIQGGADYNQPLSVQRVTPGTLASQQLDPGDVLIMIEGQDARLMCHFDACELIKMAGNTVELIVRKANSKHLCDENLEQQEKLEQTVVEERYRQEEEKRRRKALKDSMSPPFSSNSSVHSHPTRSPPAGGTSPKELPMSPNGAVVQPQMPQVSLVGNEDRFSYPSTHFHFSERNLYETPAVTGIPGNSLLQSQLRQIMSPPIRPFLPISSSSQKLMGELHPVSTPVQMSFNNRLPLSPPIRPAIQRLFPLSPPTLPTFPKPFGGSPPVRHPNDKSHRYTDPLITSSFQSFNTEEKVECYTISQPETMPVGSSITPHQAQKTIRSQTVSSVQQMSSEHSNMIRSSGQVTLPCSVANVTRRMSCSPQRIIPPLPKTIFADDKPSQNKFPGEFQRSQSTQEYESNYHTTKYTENARRSSLKSDTPNRSLRLFSPKPFSPPMQDSDIYQTIASPSINAPATSNFSTPLHMFSPHNFHSNQQSAVKTTEVNPQALSKKLQALAQSEDVASSSSQGSATYASVDPVFGLERRSISQEREPMTIEEYKQRQLQKLIEEKVRLEEMMMIAKRRQSLSEFNEPSVKKKEYKVVGPEAIESPNAREISEQALELEPTIKNHKGNLVSTKSESITNLTSLVENKTPAIREKEEESRLRKENQIRDEKIRKMQEKRYEEKLKRNVSKPRESTCPPESKLAIRSQTNLKDSSRRSRERFRDAPKERIWRDRSCPINLDLKETDRTEGIKTEEASAKDKTSLASSFISSMLRDMNVGFRGFGERKSTSINKTEKNIPINHEENETQKIQTTGITLVAGGRSDICSTEKKEVEKQSNNDEKRQLFESLKKDQQRIQEEFRKREEQKRIKQQQKEMEDKQMAIDMKAKFHYDAQILHEQFQKQEHLNKEVEHKVQDSLQYQEQGQGKSAVPSEASQQKFGTDQATKDKDKIKKVEKEMYKGIVEKKTQSKPDINNQELHLSELQEQLKRKEELQWQELQKESKVQVPKPKQTFLTKDDKIQERERSAKFPNEHKATNILKPVEGQEKLEAKKIEDTKKFEAIKQEEEKRQQELKIRENILKMEEKKLIEKIISEEERKLVEQKRTIEEKLKKQSKDSSDKSLSNAEEKMNKITTSALTKEQQPECQANVLAGQISEINPDEEFCKEDNVEETIDDLRKEEEERMKEEAKIYEDYKRHLETKRKGHSYDSDDYASDTGEEEEVKDKPRGVYLEEKFDELKATSEEELFDAQEKSIRNLERQIRKQKQREMRKSYERRQQASNQLSRKQSKLPSNEGESLMPKKYCSTGDLHAATPCRTRPITKFSPDPMEFGFRPIETPHSIISRSVGNLMSGGGPSASSIAHVAGAEAGVAAIKKPVCKKFYHIDDDKALKEGWANKYGISSSLEDLQQGVSRKPPLPSQAKLKAGNLRHATSEETIVKYDRPCEDPRRHTYTEGEDFSELAYLDTLELDPCDYGTLLNEYYAAYYDTYYHSYYRRHQTEKQKEGKMMNLGPPPPPPPPPFSTGAPAPLPKQPAEVPSKAPPPVAVPAALAGAMLKDKKPFTYTPGGLNLAEIKSPRMQRRLQRNASLEGVRPSPLAQQSPPSPGASTSTIPTQGMIQVQVLPMPGMGMTPIVKPQPKESTPKPKKSVCGPAPPPPPFVVSGESSIEPSPSATPLTTPATTPAINSATPPSTPSLSTQSNSSVPGSSSNNHLNTDQSGLPSESAIDGSSIPHPPPPPPISGTLDRKKFSYPSLPSQSSSSSKSETESNLSSLSTISSSPPMVNFTSNIPQEIMSENLLDSKLPQPASASSDNNSPFSSVEKPSEHEIIDKNIDNFKQPSVPATSNNSSSFSLVEKLTDEKSYKNIENFNQPSVSATLNNINSFSPVEKLSEHENIDKNIENIKPSVDKISENENKLVEEPENKQLKINIQTSNHPSLNEINSKKTNTPDVNVMISDKKYVNQIQDILDEIDSIHIPYINEKPHKTDNTVNTKNQQSSSQNLTDARRAVAESSSVSLIKPKVTENAKESLPVRKAETNDEHSDKKQDAIVNSLSPKKLSEETSKGISNLKVKPVLAENTNNIISTPHQPFKPIARMSSPPTLSKKQDPPTFDRLFRQASLPAEPISPPAVVKPGNKGSLYIPPVKQVSSTFVENSKSAPQSAQSSSPSGLNKGPLPWMCGVKKESSPPPEFLIYTQKAQDRLQRQRSLSLQEKRQNQYSQGINPCQNGFPPTMPYTPETSVPQVYKNQTPQQQYTWRSPEHQGSSKNQSQKQYQLYQPYQQPHQPLQQLPFQQQPYHYDNTYYQQPLPVHYPQQMPQQPTQTNFAHSAQQQRHQQHQQLGTQSSCPRERIIPIVMEDLSPVTPTSTKPVAGVHNNFPSKINYPNQPRPQRHNSWPKPSSVPTSPLGACGAFSPYDPQGKYQSSSNALEALQQMQQNLAQLNSGLQTAYPRDIHQQLHFNSSPSHPVFSGQTQPEQNGAPFMVQQAGFQDPMQSRSFRVLQNAYEPQEVTGNQVQDCVPEPKKYMGSHIPSRSFKILQAMTDDGPGPGESDL